VGFALAMAMMLYSGLLGQYISACGVNTSFLVRVQFPCPTAGRPIVKLRSMEIFFRIQEIGVQTYLFK
jgi:hypothetical protein